MVASISQAEEAAIERYFSAGCAFERSTFGALLQRQELIAKGADGRRHKLSKRSWWWMPDQYVGHNRTGLISDPHPRLPPMALHSDERSEASYEPDERLLEMFGHASRRMLAVERLRAPGEAREHSLGLRAKRVLEAWYGDRGRRWEWYATDRVDGAGKKILGCGPGRVAAVFVLTESGAEFLERERARSAKRAGVDVIHLTHDDLLANVYAIQKAQPDPQRAARLNRIQDEADQLVLEARRAWLKTAPIDPHGEKRQARMEAIQGRARAWRASNTRAQMPAPGDA